MTEKGRHERRRTRPVTASGGAADERTAGEALGVIDQKTEDRESSAQETLAEVQDILSGAYEDARTILGIDAGGGGA
jgi:predicted MarR family transcription regulator